MTGGGVTSHARRLVAVGVAVGVGAALVVGAATWAILAQGPGTAHEPDLGSDFRVLRLSDGRDGEVAVSSSQRVVVRWRAAGDDSWSAPLTAYDDPDRYLVSTSVRVRGTTLAVRAYYSTEMPTDEPSQGVDSSVFIVCRPGSCSASDHYEQVREAPCRRGSCVRSRPESQGSEQVPEFDAAGDLVFFGVTEKGYVVWEPGTGPRELSPSGLTRPDSASVPLLAPDGTFRFVSGKPVSGGCLLTLFVSARGEPAYVEAHRQRVPSATGRCATTPETFSPDYLLAHTDRPTPVSFVRAGGAWTTADRDPSGIVRFDRAPGRTAEGSVIRTGYWHWREVVTASPDGRRLVVQLHVPGAPTWTKPVVVARAPRGATCFEIAPTSTPSEEPFYVTMRCFTGTSLRDPGSWLNVHAITEDGRTWHSAVGTDLPTRVNEDLYFAGRPAYRWSADDGLERVDLPIGPHSVAVLVDQGTQVLVSVRPRGDRCRLEVRVAAQGATAWSAPIRNHQPFLPPGEPCEPCEPDAQYSGKQVLLYFESRSMDWMPAVVEQKRGEWVVTAERRAG